VPIDIREHVRVTTKTQQGTRTTVRKASSDFDFAAAAILLIASKSLPVYFAAILLANKLGTSCEAPFKTFAKIMYFMQARANFA
jgi:hypothetical protein